MLKSDRHLNIGETKLIEYNRRNFLQLAGFSAASLAVPSYGCIDESSYSKKINFVFILADDLGWSDLGCYGADLHETPNLDRLAQQGMRFTDAYAASPVCSPTRASILTGKYPARLNMTTWRENAAKPPAIYKHIPPIAEQNLPLEETTIAEALKNMGYQTAHIGKWHLGGAEHYPEAQGFDINIGGTIWGAPATYFYPYRGERAQGKEIRYVPHLEFGHAGEYLTDRLTDEALRALEFMKDGPFYLNLAYHSVHTPIEGKPDYAARFAKKLKPEFHHQNPDYAAMVQSLDENVGRILAKIDELGLSDNTVVFFFSDNGGYINENRGKAVTSNAPLRSGKGSLYEGGVREPLFIRWPGVAAAGSVCHEPVCSIDFFSTILEMNGVSASGVDGVSLVPLLKDPKTSLNRERLYWHYPHYYPTTTPAGSIREGDWKLIEYFEDERLELYNLREDLSEKNNLSQTQPQKAAELLEQLQAWRKEVNARMSAPNPNYKPGGPAMGF
ncbi:MAG: sulfatase [Candidatus Omnitrophota bacterium]